MIANDGSQERRLVLVDLEPAQGSEQGKTRPAVVVQNDIGNKHSPTTIVAPLTSSYDQVYPVNVEITAESSDLKQDSIVLLNQLVTIDIEARISHKLGQLNEKKLREVDRALAISLGLD